MPVLSYEYLSGRGKFHLARAAPDFLLDTIRGTEGAIGVTTSSPELPQFIVTGCPWICTGLKPIFDRMILLPLRPGMPTMPG